MKSLNLFAAAFAVVCIAGCGSDSARVSTKVEQLRTEPTSAKVEERDIVGYLLMDGELYVPPTSEAVVRAPYDAPVEQVLADVGKRVGKGELIIKMSLPDQKQYFAQAQANVKAAETAYGNARITYEAPLREAERQLAQARSTERTLRTQAAQGGDGGELQQAVEARQAAEEAVLRAKGEANANLLEYKQQLDAARLNFQQARSGVRQANVTSPITGTVLEMKAQSGQPLTGGAPVARIVDLGDIQIKANLTTTEAGVVEKDKGVVVTFVGMEDKPFNGVVTQVQTLPADTTGVKRTVTIDFKNDDGLVKPGMQIKSVGIKIGEAHDVLAVPADAVFQDKDGKTCVRVMENKDWVVRVVETGLSDGFFTQVKSGLKEGDTVRVPGAI